MRKSGLHNSHVSRSVACIVTFQEVPDWAFLHVEYEIQSESVITKVQSAGLVSELGGIKKLEADAVVCDVAQTPTNYKRVDPVRVEAIKWFDIG